MSNKLLDVIAEAALGVKTDSLSAQGSEFSVLYSQIFDQPPAGQVISLINTFIPVRSWLPLKANTDFLHATREVRRQLRNTIKERRAEIFGEGTKKREVRHERTEEGSKDLLTFILYERSEGDNKWSDEDILGHLLNFMAAGHETTATALVWATLTLCLHPRIQARLRSEIQSKIPHSNPPSFAELETLTYMNAFFKEVLRCLSPTVMIARTPAKELTLCGTVIPVGTTCFLDPQSIHFNPSIWGPDAEFFNPDRHLPGHSSEKEFPQSRDPYAIETLSNGPRICIGKLFAIAEFKSMMVELLRNFEMTRGWDKNGDRLDEDEECEPDEEGLEGVFAGVRLKNSITLRWKEGVYVRFRPREN
jgi:cytochrome P450